MRNRVFGNLSCGQCPCVFSVFTVADWENERIVTRVSPLFHLSSDLRPVVFIPINTLSIGEHNALLATAALHQHSFTREWVSNKACNIPTFLITVERPSCVLLIYLIQSTAAQQMLLKWLRVTGIFLVFEIDMVFRKIDWIFFTLVKTVMVFIGNMQGFCFPSGRLREWSFSFSLTWLLDD